MRNAEAAITRPNTSLDDWQILRVLSIYRIALAGMLVVLFYAKVAPHVLGDKNPELFQSVIYAYLAGSAVLMFLLQRSWPPLFVQAYIQFTADAAVITLLAFASAGVPSGLGTLLITPTVACALVLGTRMAMLMASLATVMLFSEEFYRQFPFDWNVGAFTQTGILGAILMMTALAGNLVAQRARKSEARAARVGTELANMSRLNENIVEILQTGVVVVDADGHIRMLNAAARRLLGSPKDPVGRELREIAPPLQAEYVAWRADAQFEPAAIQAQTGAPELLPRFNRLGWGEATPVLILLEDTASLRQHAQQIKLAALGRLSASIAHEIRNPLNAISQASQLLEESSDLAAENRKLVDMVRRHSERINKIVIDVLSLSRRDMAWPESLPLREWLQRTISQYQEADADGVRRIEFGVIPEQLQVQFDPNHLYQVLGNLWDNAFDHAGPPGTVTITLNAGQDHQGTWLDVQDNGRGISGELLEQIYEPFFTTAHSGTGLGLFMARELCEYNRARLQCEPAEQGARFRIIFSQPEPQH